MRTVSVYLALFKGNDVLDPLFFLGHGEQEDIYGHDAEGGCWSALPTVHLPHPTKHEVTTDATSVYLSVYQGR